MRLQTINENEIMDDFTIAVVTLNTNAQNNNFHYFDNGMIIPLDYLHDYQKYNSKQIYGLLVYIFGLLISVYFIIKYIDLYIGISILVVGFIILLILLITIRYCVNKLKTDSNGEYMNIV